CRRLPLVSRPEEIRHLRSLGLRTRRRADRGLDLRRAPREGMHRVPAAGAPDLPVTIDNWQFVIGNWNREFNFQLPISNYQLASPPLPSPVSRLRLHLLPQLIQLLQPRSCHVNAALGRETLDCFESPAEFPIGPIDRRQRLHP